LSKDGLVDGCCIILAAAVDADGITSLTNHGDLDLAVSLVGCAVPTVETDD
jgi:hypothetical protein